MNRHLFPPDVPRYRFILSYLPVQFLGDIIGYEGYYEVSEWGEVFSLYIFGSGVVGKKRRQLKGIINPKGYLSVGLYKEGKMKIFRVNRLVAEAFISNHENKSDVNHKDGNKLNNSASNLEWATSSENIKHSYAIGIRSKKGENHHTAKLTNENVQMIRLLYAQGGITHREISLQYNVTKECIRDIVNRKRWQHI